MKKIILLLCLSGLSLCIKAQDKKEKKPDLSASHPIENTLKKVPPVDTTLCNTAISIIQCSFTTMIDLKSTVKTTAGIDVSKQVDPSIQQLNALAQYFMAYKKQLAEDLSKSKQQK